jgi:N-methylhydantoinase A
MPFRVGIDIGGTFTDLFGLEEETGRFVHAKCPSTPAQPEQAVFDTLTDSGLNLDAISFLVIGTTISTNALLQRRGARVIYLTTAGFEDVPFIQRINRKYHYDLAWVKPAPFVARADCLGVVERVGQHGEIVKPLEVLEMERVSALVAERMSRGDSIAIAINFLFSYLNPMHEQMMRDFLLKRFPSLSISVSHEVAPIWREYERGSTTIIDAFCKPTLARFVENLSVGLQERRFTRPWALMKSNGGIVFSHNAARRPVDSILSGLAGGIIAGRYFGEKAGDHDVITLDMGGTSADVGSICQGRINFTTEYELDFGIPVAAPFIELTTIGAGGGSIGWIDRGGFLKVGPQSAGADPGPVCYGRGGRSPTVTDANLVLGRLNPNYFLGGKMPLAIEPAQGALQSLGERLGMSAQEAALAMIDLVNENMANAIRLMTVKKGLDPREFGLVAFGGAGPLHAAALAASLEMKHVVIPPHPGLGSAFGSLLGDIQVDRRWTRFYRSDTLDAEAVQQEFDELVRQTVDELRADGFQGEPIIRRSIDMRYSGQNYEQEISLPPGEINNATIRAALDEFHSYHQKFYGYSFPDETIELIHFNVTVYRRAARPDLVLIRPGGPEGPVARRAVFFKGLGFLETPIYRRAGLGRDSRLEGPAIIEEEDSTVLLHPGQNLTLTEHGLLIISGRPEDYFV